MIQDAELERLNSLVANKLAEGVSASRALEPLHQVLEDSVIRAEDLVFNTGSCFDPLPRNLLLHSFGALSTHLDRLYSDISGSGAHYNGMYGNCDMLRNPSVAAAIARTDRAPASITEQVVLTVRLLTTPQASLMPELAAAARRHLSTIMLKYPVLLHPSILIPTVRNVTSNVEYTSLAAALATSPHGALPRYSHFRTKADDKAHGVDQALVRQLTKFAEHPCVSLAMTRAAHRVRQDATATSRARQFKMGKESLVRTALSITGPRVEFLASVMEMDELSNGSASSASVTAVSPRPFYASVDGEESLRTQLDAMLAASVAAASGLVHVAALQGTLPDAMRAHAPDMAFLADIRRRRAHLFGLDPEQSAMGQSLIMSTQRRVFLGRSDSLCPEELTHNTRNLAMGLAYVGFCGSTQEAAAFIFKVCVGEMRPDGRFPNADTGGAVAFLKAIDELGGLGGTDDEAVATAERLKSAAGAERKAYSDAWAQAAEVFGTERLMMSVINRAARAKPVAPTDDAHANPSLDAGTSRRRARASV